MQLALLRAGRLAKNPSVTRRERRRRWEEISGEEQEPRGTAAASAQPARHQCSPKALPAPLAPEHSPTAPGLLLTGQQQATWDICQGLFAQEGTGVKITFPREPSEMVLELVQDKRGPGAHRCALTQKCTSKKVRLVSASNPIDTSSQTETSCG